MLHIEITDSQIKALGARLRALRIERGDTQAMFAHRIGVSVPTLRAMETGNPGTAIGYWANALWMLGRQEDLAALLKPSTLFDTPARQRQRARQPTRQRP